jgi:hypothetical protein
MALWSVHSTFRTEHRIQSRDIFSTTLLSYTLVKFNQEKNEPGIRGGATQAQAIARGGRRYHPSN